MQKLPVFVIILFLFSSCSNYYKITSTPATAANIENLNSHKKYLILHSGSRTFTINNISITNQNTVNCTLENIPEEHTVYITKKKKKTYKAASGEYDQRAVLNEAHIYITDSSAAIGNYSIQASSLQKIEVIEKDKIKTSRSRVKGVLISVGAVALVVLIAAGISLSHWKSL